MREWDELRELPCIQQEPERRPVTTPHYADKTGELTLSSHFECTDMPHNLHVFPCLLKPQMDD